MSRITIISLATAVALAVGVSWQRTQAQESATKLTAEDYVEIYNLYAKYTRAADMGGKGDGSDWAATFTPDGTFGKAQGPDALKKIITDFHIRLRRDGWSSRHTYTTIQLQPI